MGAGRGGAQRAVSVMSVEDAAQQPTQAHTQARRRSGTLTLRLWRHQGCCVTQVAAVLIKRGLFMMKERQTLAPRNNSALSVKHCHLSFFGQNLPLLLAVSVAHPLFWNSRCSLFDPFTYPVCTCVINFRKTKQKNPCVLLSDWCGTELLFVPVACGVM